MLICGPALFFWWGLIQVNLVTSTRRCRSAALQKPKPSTSATVASRKDGRWIASLSSASG